MFSIIDRATAYAVDQRAKYQWRRVIYKRMNSDGHVIHPRMPHTLNVDIAESEGEGNIHVRMNHLWSRPDEISVHFIHPGQEKHVIYYLPPVGRPTFLDVDTKRVFPASAEQMNKDLSHIIYQQETDQ